MFIKTKACSDTAVMDLEDELKDCLVKMFRNASQVHTLSSGLFQQSSLLKEISMNAAIASGHTGAQGRVFSEIAKQIALISSFLSRSVDQIQENTSRMSGQILGSIIKYSLKEKLVIASRQLVQGSNQKILHEVSANFDKEISFLLGKAQDQLARVKPDHQRIREITSKAWAITINLRVSASLAQELEREFFFSIAESLEKMVKEVSGIIESLSVAITNLDHLLMCRFQQLEEFQYGS